MIHGVAILLIVTALSGCKVRQWYPALGGAVGGVGGSLVGGPIGGGLGASGGVLIGEVAKGNKDLDEAKQTITALSEGDVQALLAKGMEKHASGFDAFTATIKRILTIASVCLIAYLCIPILVAKRCGDNAVRDSLTRAPFPVKPPTKK